MGSSFSALSDSRNQRRPENLAYLFQETFTVAARLRANRQPVRDPADFRRQIISTISSCSQEAVRRGYTQDDVKLAAYAVVALLDELILNSSDAMFSDWIRNPLQAQLFGVLLAGEHYFQNIDALLARPDSQEVADILEVYLLGLSLGLRGRHSKESGTGTGRATVRNVNEMIREKIRRIRGTEEGLYFTLDSSAPTLRPMVDPWRKRLMWVAAAAWIIAVLLFAGYKLSLMQAPGSITPTEAAAN